MATDKSFTVGKQGCDKFKPQQVVMGDHLGTNVHECYRCQGTVSFCENCCYDHHENGHETCMPRTEEKND